VKPDCPFCSSLDCELVSQFGGQIITAQWRCRSCGSYFEALREDFDEPQPARLDGTLSTRSTTAPRR
jgi:uncharacterized Zn finger protein